MVDALLMPSLLLLDVLIHICQAAPALRRQLGFLLGYLDLR